MSAPSKLLRASKTHPCPVCQGTHKCSRTPNGLILCGRRSGPVEGFTHRGPASNPTWHLYADPAASDRWTPAPTPAAPPPDFPADADHFARRLTPEAKAALAAKLGLPAAALDRFPRLGFDPDRNLWVLPEVDGHGTVIGLATRAPDGSKKCRAGSRRGLTLPAGWDAPAGPVFVVEGFSDAAALAHCGVCVVGRPSNATGADLVADLLAAADPARPVVVFGENDRKADGSWPGFDGADLVSKEVARRLPGRTVLVAMPPDDYKDCREWVLDRAAGFAEAEDWEGVGRDIAAAVGRKAKLVADARRHLAPAPDARPGRFKVAVPAPRIAAAVRATGTAPWVWDGFLARGRVTLLSALPKCGKTTLIGHLLKALPAGGEFCGRPLAPGAALVVSEESDEVWADRATALALGEQVRILSQPFFGRPDPAEWADWLREQVAALAADPADLVVFDTLADLWPVRDENSATEVQAALKPVRKLAEGRAVLLVHHLRKSDGEDGTGSRGSGALAGFVDVIAELRKAKATQGGGANRRVLTAVGRGSGIPKEWVIDLDEAGGFRHVAAGDQGSRDDARRCELRKALLAVMPTQQPGATVDGLFGALPDGLRKNVIRLREVLNAEAGKLWWREGNTGKGGAYTFWREPGMGQ